MKKANRYLLKVKLLSKVREMIFVKAHEIEGIQGYLIICKPPVNFLPAETIVICDLKELKDIVRNYRLKLAKELLPEKKRKKKKFLKKKEVMSDIIKI